MYEIFKQNDDGDWVNIETGDIGNAENRRTKARPQEAQKAADRLDKEGGKRQSRKGSKTQRVADPELIVTDQLRRTEKLKRRKSPLSPFQQRVNAELALAKQQLALRKARDAE